MAVAPSTPKNVKIQQANAQILISWGIVAGATNYVIYRSLDQLTYASVATVAVPQYLDTTVTEGIQYWYTVTASNGTESPSSATVTAVPAKSGAMSLYQLRQEAKQRADRLNSGFVTDTEWNSYINQSAFELYDLLTQAWEDYNVKDSTFVCTAGVDMYDLPDDFYKLIGVDLALAGNANAWVTVKKFDFISRNRYLYPQLSATVLGVFNLKYRLLDKSIKFIPGPTGGQTIKLWYIPRMVQLLLDTDILDSVSGWLELVIVDAAIKALQKEESDVSTLMVQKGALIDRIKGSARSRDAGQPDSISNTRTKSELWGGYSTGDGDGPSGGW